MRARLHRLPKSESCRCCSDRSLKWTEEFLVASCIPEYPRLSVPRHQSCRNFSMYLTPSDIQALLGYFRRNSLTVMDVLPTEVRRVYDNLERAEREASHSDDFSIPPSASRPQSQASELVSHTVAWENMPLKSVSPSLLNNSPYGAKL